MAGKFLSSSLDDECFFFFFLESKLLLSPESTRYRNDHIFSHVGQVKILRLKRICIYINPIALRMAKTLWSFGRSECSRVKGHLEE